MRINRSHLVSGLVFLVGLACASALPAQSPQARAKLAASIPAYQPLVQLKGTIDLVGTDALSELGEEWASVFRKFHPEGSLVFRPGLTKDAVKAFMDGTSLLIITAREFSQDEAKAFQAKYGYQPMRIPICMDANIVFVNKNNPITSISMEQLDAIFSATRLSGAKAPAVVWGDLGLRGEWAKLPINAYTRAPGTATNASVKEKVLLNGTYRPGILSRDDAAALAEAIMTDQTGIAISTMASWYVANKVLPVVPLRGEDARFPNQENVTTSKYPMPRLYYAYLNRTPGSPLPGPVHEVIHFLLTQPGQNAAADSGLLPGPPEFIQIALKRLSR
ncbi:MAG: substrate-binding domain-containing protein [Holophagaceae bacterium]|uniref:Substrate-binding domain-containing protein n=1 Tax=Candidatus Geothrix skivensis TaxID=2954439 RepID=A0A9D7SEN3_9BACT|nr:substrate-binding domain-containing protein [Candidatus Geothrix skivensis]